MDLLQTIKNLCLTSAKVFFSCCTKKLLKFSGRSSRREFLYFLLFYVTGLPLLVFFYFLGGPCDILYEIIGESSVGLGFTMIYLPMPALLSLTSRRLHDVDKKGIYAIALFIPVINLVIFYFCFKKGDEGPNQYGNEPVE